MIILSQSEYGCKYYSGMCDIPTNISLTLSPNYIPCEEKVISFRSGQLKYCSLRESVLNAKHNSGSTLSRHLGTILHSSLDMLVVRLILEKEAFVILKVGLPGHPKVISRNFSGNKEQWTSQPSQWKHTN